MKSKQLFGFELEYLREDILSWTDHFVLYPMDFGYGFVISAMTFVANIPSIMFIEVCRDIPPIPKAW